MGIWRGPSRELARLAPVPPISTALTDAAESAAAAAAAAAATPSYRWRLTDGWAASSLEFPGIAGGSPQVFLAAPYMILAG
jgi:TRAP-type mannitol/chloroaromatic compound transport system substrate-binding protein